MSSKPSIPKGTRDFSPVEVAKRTYIMNTIRSQFQHYGFQPIETPSFENSSTLMGKYGEEGDRLIFKILDSGEYIEKAKLKIEKVNSKEIAYLTILLEEVFIHLKSYIIKSDIIEHNNGPLFLAEFINNRINGVISSSAGIADVNRFENDIVDFFKANALDIGITLYRKNEFFTSDDSFQNFKMEELREFQERLITYLNIKYFHRVPSKALTPQISEKALRYDLTVPFARYVVQHQNDIVFPFKRFQIQPVWRADRPQKGRFREFYQCDADVVGSDSLWQEVEFVQLYDAVFTALKLEGVTIKMNNRKVLSGIAEVIGASDKLIDFTVALDKLDKIGEEGVTKEMLSKGITQEAINKVAPLFSLSGNFGEQLETLQSLLSDSETGKEGIKELLFINDAISNLGLQTATLQLDVTLARGLNYYTGAIFEVAAPEGVKMGSIGGGGRYADLTGIFGLKDMSGVGISFGLDRIALVLEELNLFPEDTTEGVKVFFVNFGDTEASYAMQAIGKLRKAGISAELYPDPVTSNKQMKKQMTYANRRNIPFLVLAGTQEVEDKTFTLKNMAGGTQETVSFDSLLKHLSS